MAFQENCVSIHRGKFKIVLRAYGTPEKRMLPVMFMLSLPFHILAGILHIYTLALYLFIPALDFALRGTVIEKEKFKITMVRKSRRVHPNKGTDFTSSTFKGNGQNYCTQTVPTILQKYRWSLRVPPFPHLKRWCLVCIAPTLSGVETKKKIQTSLCHFSSNASFMHT